MRLLINWITVRAAESVPSVAEALDTLRTADVDGEVVTGTGPVTQAILGYADEVDADCICVGARQRSPAGKRALRHGAQRIIVTANRPVLVVGDIPESESARS